MTIIIGALCSSGKEAIFCADTETVMGALIIENTPKVHIITDHAVVLTSGLAANYLFLKEAIQNAAKTSSIEQMANALAVAYRIFRFKKIEWEILPLHGFGSLDGLFSRQKNLNDVLVGSISEQIKNANLYVDLIVGGVDEKAHLYQISHPGTYFCCDTQGFCCVGSGGSRASTVFDFFHYSQDMNQEEVMKIVYCAKKRSEKIGGIGKQTAIRLITKEGTAEISSPQIEMFEQHYLTYKEKHPEFWA